MRLDFSLPQRKLGLYVCLVFNCDVRMTKEGNGQLGERCRHHYTTGGGGATTEPAARLGPTLQAPR